jgi:multiple sugar transport system substrate-binding protein
MNTTGPPPPPPLLDVDFNWDIAPMWQGEEQAVSAFGSGLAISRDSKHAEQAFQAIDFLTDAEAQAVIIKNAQDVPANLEVQQSEAFLKPEWATREVNMGAFGESSSFVFRSPLIPEWNEMQAAFDDNLGTFWNEGGDAKTQLDTIQKQLESIIKPAS